VAAPCVVAGLVPWLITDGKCRTDVALCRHRWPRRRLLVLAIVVLVRAFARFVTEGRGTPAPIAPTERLVVGGDYRFRPQPMYWRWSRAILGQAMIFGSLGLLLYAVRSGRSRRRSFDWYEEPGLARALRR
jgi:protein-S-isoprenylcysteine O-methyltransferase Ste14